MNTTFDPPFNHVPPHPPQPIFSATPGPQRKRSTRPADTDDYKLIQKRAKAAARQRNKRDRDRRKALELSQSAAMQGVEQAAGPSNAAQQHSQPQQPALSKEEEARREKMRAAARERQRKHRALVKQKKMAELGFAIGQDGVAGMEEMHYALGPDGSYQPVLPPNAHPPELPNPDQPFPPGHGAQTGGQTFASTLLLSFSCSPLLKQHLLRTLHMTNEELCSLEPILSAAWEQWDHARRLHYAEQAAKASAEQQNGTAPPGSAPPPHAFGPPPPPSSGTDPSVQDPNDFRTRFHRPLTAPSPFGPNGVPGAPPVAAHIDPSLGAASSTQPANGVLARVVQAAERADSLNGAGAKHDTEGESANRGEEGVDANAATEGKTP